MSWGFRGTPAPTLDVWKPKVRFHFYKLHLEEEKGDDPDDDRPIHNAVLVAIRMEQQSPSVAVVNVIKCSA